MKKVFLALTLLVLASLACSLGNASPSAPPPAAASAPSTNPTVEPAPSTLRTQRPRLSHPLPHLLRPPPDCAPISIIR
jgi:predicted small lipoprotein YifL